MAGDLTGAAVYARALIEAAGDDAPAVDAALQSLVEALEADPALWQSLLSPGLDDAQRKAALDRAVEGLPTARNFLRVLVDNGRLEALPDILREYHELVLEREAELDVTVSSAVELSPELRSQLEQRLATSTGKQVRLHTSVDPSIIGGLVIKHGDVLVDSSIRGRLEQLRLQLRQR